MALSQQSKAPKWLSWFKGGGLFVAISLGLHWALLQVPIAEEVAPEAIAPEGLSSEAPTETIDVVRLPDPSPEPQPEPSTAPAPIVEPQPAPPTALAPGVTARPQIPQLQPTTQPTPTPQPSPAPEAEPGPEPEPAPEPALTPEPAPDLAPMTLDERLQTFAEYQPNNRGKSLATETNEFMNWYLSQTWDGLETAPLPAPKELTALVVNYPLNQCLVPPPTDGQLEVIVNPDGALARDPKVLGSTGYDVLDEKAVENTAQYDFPTNEGLDEPVPTVYWLPVEVAYDAVTCTP
jgi:hypothetical protein